MTDTKTKKINSFSNIECILGIPNFADILQEFSELKHNYGPTDTTVNNPFVKIVSQPGIEASTSGIYA